ncbi:MAG: hypothetical protein ACEQSX_00435 [Baekduiaceae bacterium]
MIRKEVFDKKGKPRDRAQRLVPDTVPVIADILHESSDGITFTVRDVTIHYLNGDRAVFTRVEERERNAPDAG